MMSLKIENKELLEALLKKYPALSEEFYESMRQINSIIEKIPEGYKQLLNKLASHGWFMDLWIDQFNVAKNLVINEINNSDSLDLFMCKYFKSKSNDIKKTLCKRFSSRAKIIETAFKAHKRREFELSIPVFLAQSDGICLDLIGEKLFSKHKKKVKTEKWIVKNIPYGLMRALLEPLCTPNPISASERESTEYPNIFNRHKILHGIDTEYANEVNSFKAISLLNYVANFLYMAKVGVKTFFN